MSSGQTSAVTLSSRDLHATAPAATRATFPAERGVFSEMSESGEMHVGLESLTSEAVARIHDALHDLKDPGLHKQCMDALWLRHGTAAHEWPVSMEQSSDPDDASRPFSSMSVVRFCARASSPTDPGHRPIRSLLWTYLDIGGRERTFHGLLCSCGADVERWHRYWQAEPSARVWPTVIRDGVPCYQVCTWSRGADDPAHAPRSAGNCLCSATLGCDLDVFLPQK